MIKNKKTLIYIYIYYSRRHYMRAFVHTAPKLRTFLRRFAQIQPVWVAGTRKMKGQPPAKQNAHRPRGILALVDCKGNAIPQSEGFLHHCGEVLFNTASCVLGVTYLLSSAMCLPHTLRLTASYPALNVYLDVHVPPEVIRLTSSKAATKSIVSRTRFCTIIARSNDNRQPTNSGT